LTGKICYTFVITFSFDIIVHDLIDGKGVGCEDALS